MNIKVQWLGLAALIPSISVGVIQGANAAGENSAPPAANSTAPAPDLAPRQGEIKVEGIVQTLDTTAGKLVLLVSAVTLPGKDPINLNPARPKTVTVNDATTLLRAASGSSTPGAPALKLIEITPEVKVTVVGKDLGVGKEVPARLLSAAVAAPPAAVILTPGAPQTPAAFQAPDGPPATTQEIQTIHDYVFGNKITELTALLDQKPSLVKGPFPQNDTPVHQAVFWGHPEIVQLFLDRGAGLEVKNGSGQTPLMTALAWGKADMARMLIDRGADINTEENDGKTPLGLAREKNFADLVALLEQRNAIEEGPTRGPSAIKRGAPMFEAVKAQNAAAVKALLQQDPKLANARNTSGETPLIADVFWGNMAIAQLLLDNGVDVNAKSDWNDTALKKAQFFHKDDLLALLKQHGARE